ncbi:carbohydrate ABC transporter permease [Hominifimenecus sp. rT4P-3]|uniref:carbohydrate ABC transporter permease n=1 Tax=Hominifimenecus sp. rT4P-3 TaxID=3242979 RepID=UPI003DA1FF86
MKRKILIGGILTVFGLIICYPVIYLLSGSLMGNGELKEGLLPILTGGGGFVAWHVMPLFPTLKNFVELLLDSPEFFVMFWNSVKITAGILVGQLILGVPAAWGFAKYRFPGRRLFFGLYVLLMILPFQVMMLSQYLVLDGLGLMNTHLGIILPAVFSTFPVFIMVRFFDGVPDQILESAKIDGAGAFQIFWRIGVPLGAGGIISAMVLSFLEYWNLVEQPLTFLKDPSLWPLSLYLPNIDLDYAGIAFTSSVVTLIPAVLVFFCGQEYLEQGIVASAVKE